ncbi:MAG: sigma-70 family RNA polymerase sigma factor, partial [Oscillospiraceae bacterium]|nr:sigma-70 family RNA polymerase sigma factor [Oscillospiraceae bacterium]
TEAQPELALDRQESARLVREILSELPEGQQTILGMRYYEDLDINEIADILKLSPGTVKTQLHRGRKRVETRVRELERQGLKLYGLSPLAFLLALLHEQAPATGAEAKTMQAVLAKTAELGVPSVTLTAQPIGTRFFLTAAGKFAAGLLGLALTGGAVFGAAKLMGSGSAPIGGNYQPTDSSLRLAVTEPDSLHALAAVQSTGDDSPEDLPPEERLPGQTEASSASEVLTPAPAEQHPFSGSCGEHLSWWFDPDSGTLNIEGSGAMTDFDYEEIFSGGENICPDDEISDEHDLITDSDHDEIPWKAYSPQITAVNLPEGLTKIGRRAFSNCTALTQVDVPDHVTDIGEAAFSYCDSLTRIGIPDSVTNIDASAFCGCSALTDVSIPKGVTQIHNSTFSGCSALADISIPANVTEIGEYAFRYCSSLRRVDIPSRVNRIGEGAFYDCDALTGVSIPDGVTHIGEFAFQSCDALTDVVLPEGLTYIGNYAFGSCNALETVSLPASVTEICLDAFVSCIALDEIQVASGNPVYCSLDGVLLNKAKTELIQYPAGKTGSYQIPDSVTQIESDAFYNCGGLTGVRIPDSVTSIGGSAFMNCSALTRVNVPKNLTHIPYNLFSACSALTEIEIPDGVVDIDEYAFCNCSSLRSVSIPESVTFVAPFAFSGCSALRDVHIPKSVCNIGDNAFGCSVDPAGNLARMEDFRIHGFRDSLAQRYAEENGFSFLPLD